MIRMVHAIRIVRQHCAQTTITPTCYVLPTAPLTTLACCIVGHDPTTNKNCKQAVVLKHNKPRPVLRIALFLGTDQKCNQSRGHSTPSLKISCKSVQPFSRNLAYKETNKHRSKTLLPTPSPSIPRYYRGRGNK